ncbi:MAG: hypothetical protein HXY20_03240 [Acidobacteria bacterium]|nr:hypothetical protein [Acidobacteriota bacterium]
MRQGQIQARNEEGMALLIALVALTLISLIGFLSALDAATELKISDNYESRTQAIEAAQAGLNHARELLRGLSFDDQLAGSDGIHDSSTTYLALARRCAFRNPISWVLARSLHVSDPAGDVAGMSDDGLINTGPAGTSAGVGLIPVTGVPVGVSSPGMGTFVRYFVKVTDNNGEASEILRDPSDDPFHDGDGIVIVRSMGVASTIGEAVGPVPQWNSVALAESRLRIRRVFQLDSPLVVQGLSVEPSGVDMFSGDSFLISGGSAHVGIGVIDPDLLDSLSPAQELISGIAASQEDNIQGAGLTPSVGDFTAGISAHSEKRLLLEKAYLRDFAYREVPRFADNVFVGGQVWSAGNVPDLGHFDPAIPAADPVQRPMVTFVDGDLTLDGGIEGAGLLIVTGALRILGGFGFRGLVLLVGSGDVEAQDMSPGLSGGLYIAALMLSGTGLEWATPRISISGTSVISMDEDAIEMALRLIPPAQLGCREITPTLDP